jgi:hypothetical protein
MATIEQPGIEMLFQLLDLKGHRRLGHEQDLGRLGKRQLLGHRMEHLKPPISHKTALHLN